MSESSISAAAVPARRSRTWVIILTALLAFLGLVYVSGYFVLPRMILSAFQESNCAAVLARGDLYARFYRSVNNDVTGPIRECAVYTLAEMHIQKSAWYDAYNASSVYSASYPQGRFVDDVHGHFSAVLIGLAREDKEQQDYAGAVILIDRVLQEYDDPALLQEAESLKLEILMDWGASLRDAGHFTEAEQLFNEVQKSDRTDDQQAAQLALAETYLDWGRELQLQHQFENAKLKIDMAASIDPNVDLKPFQSELYQQWGDYLLEQGDYANAMGIYATAAGFSAQSDPAAGEEIIANGYIQWGHVLSARQDFIGALVLLDFAQANAAGDQTKELIDSARSDVYLGFSRSDGEQAQQVMLAAANIICEHQIPSRLPILGLDSENVRTSVHGLEGDLPQTLAVTTPGSMHYVACVEVGTRIVESVVNRIISAVLNIGPPYKFLPITYERIQHVWNVTLRESDTGREVATTVIEGGEPPPFPVTLFEIQQRARDPRFWGTQPEFSDLVTWLQSETQ